MALSEVFERRPLSFEESVLAEEMPWQVFAKWFEEAKKVIAKDPNAVCLATTTSTGAPSCRMVLLKDFDDKGFVFYTNSHGRKGRELEENPQAALCFYWPQLGRQVRVEGKVELVSAEEADKYFATRPVQSRIGAWASEQSQPMKDKSVILKKIALYTAKWATGQVERPPYWNGYRVIPDYVEFWQEGEFRIHTRNVYFSSSDGWRTVLLQP